MVYCAKNLIGFAKNVMQMVIRHAGYAISNGWRNRNRN